MLIEKMRNLSDKIVEGLKSVDRVEVCIDGLQTAQEVFNYLKEAPEAFKVDYDFIFTALGPNLPFLINTGVIEPKDLIETWSEETLNKHGYFFTGEHELKDGYFYGFGNAVLKVAGLSRLWLFEEAVGYANDFTFACVQGKAVLTIDNGIFDAFENATVISKESLGHIYGKGVRYTNVMNRSKIAEH